MKMSVLARVAPQGTCFLAQTCWIDYCGDNIKVLASSKADAITYLTEYVAQFIEEYGRCYIEDWSVKGSKLNCPQAFLLLPLDAWYCKNNRENCPLQGWLDNKNPEVFFKFCTATDSTKKGVWSSIISEKYQGFHHVPGRFLCALCNNKKISFNYHYPWELTVLGNHCPIDLIWNNSERAKGLILSGFPRSAFGYLCGACFMRVSKFLHEINNCEYSIIPYNYERSR